MINLFFYLSVIAVLVYTSVIYGNTALVMLVFAGILMPVFAYVYLAVLAFLLRFSVAVPITVSEHGKTVDIEISVENKSILPVTKLVFCLRFENILTGECGTVKLRGRANPGETLRICGEVCVDSCGKYKICLRKVRIYDLTGILFLPRRCRKQAELYVMPDLYDTSVAVSEPSRHFSGETDVYGDKAGGTDASEVLQIRPFRDGDKIQSIHWKMTAKADELMVRENRQPLGCPVVLFLDLSGSRKKMDAFLMLVSAISFALLDQKCAHYVTWNSMREEDVLRLRVDDEESFYFFLMMLYEEKKGKSSVRMSDIQNGYKEKYKAEPFVTGILIGTDLTVAVGEKEHKTFTAAKLKEELSGVEFVV